MTRSYKLFYEGSVHHRSVCVTDWL